MWTVIIIVDNKSLIYIVDEDFDLLSSNQESIATTVSAFISQTVPFLVLYHRAGIIENTGGIGENVGSIRMIDFDSIATNQ